MTIKNPFLIPFLFLFFHLNSQPVDWRWATPVSQHANYSRLKVDVAGDIVLCAPYMYSVAVGGNTLIGSEYNLYLAKYSSSGTLNWVKTIARSGGLIWTKMDLDKNGNIYLAGEWDGFLNDTLQIGSTIFTNTLSTAYHSFIACFDPQGNLNWAKAFTNTAANAFTSIDVDDNGTIAVSGMYHMAAFNYSSISFPAPAGLQAIYYGAFTTGGTLSWLKANYSNTVGVLSSIHVDDAGDFLLIYYSYKPTRLTLDKMDGNGNPVWSTQLSSPNVNIFAHTPIVTDHANNIFLNINDTILKLDSQGDTLWARDLFPQSNNSNGTLITDLSMDSQGNIYATGFFNNLYMSIDGHMLINSVPSQTYTPLPTLFVAKLDGQGTVQWLKGVGGACHQRGYSLDVSGEGFIYVSGQTYCPGVFMGPDTLDYTHFVSRLDNGNYTNLEKQSVNDDFSVYPNPVHDVLHVKTNQELISLTIIDVLGRVVSYGSPGSAMQGSVDVSGLRDGIYMLEIKTKTSRVIQKLIVD